MKKPAKRKPKKPRRVVLGVGHPWFDRFKDHSGCGWRSVSLTKTAVSASILLRAFDWAEIDTKGLGNWNRVRLVAEVLK